MSQAMTPAKPKPIGTAAQVEGLLKAQWRAMTAIVPKHVTPERLARVGVASVTRTPGLAKCDPATIVEGIMAAASLGLEVNDGTGRAWLIPYGQRAQLVVGYQGLLELAYRSGMVDRIVSRAVYDGDEFSYSYGLHETLTHVPGDETDPKRLTHVYAVVSLKGGAEPLFEVMSRAQVEAIRARSKAGGGSSPWATDYPEMARKTVLRRVLKIVPRSVELIRAVNEDEERDGLYVTTHQAPATPPTVVEQMRPSVADDDPGPPTRAEVAARQSSATTEPVYVIEGEPAREPGEEG